MIDYRGAYKEMRKG